MCCDVKGRSWPRWGRCSRRNSKCEGLVARTSLWKKLSETDQGRQVAEGTVRMRLKREAGLEGYSSGSDQQVRRPWDTVRASVAGVEWGRGEDGGVHRRPRG